MAYMGYRNYETYNVALWIANDEPWHQMACLSRDYLAFRDTMRGIGKLETPDEVALNDSALDLDALNELVESYS